MSKPDHVYAPACAKNARDYLQRVVQLAVGEMNKTEFNEILSVAYSTFFLPFFSPLLLLTRITSHSDRRQDERTFQSASSPLFRLAT